MTELSVDPGRLDELLNFCVGFAKEMLAKRGEFHPFGASLRRDGQVSAAGGYAGEKSTSQEVYQTLHSGLSADFEKGDIVAAAIAADVTIPAEFSPAFSDGIRVHLECSGYSRYIYIPYRIQRQGMIGRVLGRQSTTEYAPSLSVDAEPSLCKGS